jgi:L-amino acid N-acyltransferase YncA
MSLRMVALEQSFSHRIARRDDLKDIVTIYNATIPSRQVTADIEPVSVESRIAWFEIHAPEKRPLWVTEIDGTVAAWLSFSSFYGRPAYDRTAEISVYVADKFRQRGLGRYLLNSAIAASPQLNIDTLLGLIFGHNGPSLALFERHGFERWGMLPGVAVLDGMARDLVIVGRQIQCSTG